MTNYIVSILLVVAGLGGSISMNLIPLLFPNAPKVVLKITFWGGLILFLGFIGAATYVVVGLEEGQLMRGKQTIAIILMFLCVIVFVLSARWFESEEASRKKVPLTSDSANKQLGDKLKVFSQELMEFADERQRSERMLHRDDI